MIGKQLIFRLKVILSTFFSENRIVKITDCLLWFRFSDDNFLLDINNNLHFSLLWTNDYIIQFYLLIYFISNKNLGGNLIRFDFCLLTTLVSDIAFIVRFLKLINFISWLSFVKLSSVLCNFIIYDYKIFVVYIFLNFCLSWMQALMSIYSLP